MSHFPVKKVIRANAKRLRRSMTEAEVKLWQELRAHRLMGMSFRRQMPIAGYIVDFACPASKIIVEVDGSQHGCSEILETDRIRSERLRELGWVVIRFWNDDVLRDIDGVCRHIMAIAEENGV